MAPLSPAGPAIDDAVLAVARRDRTIVGVLLAVAIVASWAWVLAGAGMGMPALSMTWLPGTMPMPDGTMADGTMVPAMEAMAATARSPAYGAVLFTMWWVMMAAMMLPSAAPMILLFATVERKQAARGYVGVGAAVFAAGYLLTWAGFSAGAVALHWLLESQGWLSAMMASAHAGLSGGLLIGAGLWQLTPVKQACLIHCRSPLQFLAHRWRPGRSGALRMGLEHGFYCVGCCWVLMGLLFLGGVMNLFWIGGLALYVLMEKTVPLPSWSAHAFGAILIAAGIGLLV